MPNLYSAPKGSRVSTDPRHVGDIHMMYTALIILHSASLVIELCLYYEHL